MTRRRLVALGQAALGLLLLALLWRALDGAEAARLLGDAAPGWLAAALLALTAQTALSAVRWRVTAGALGQRLGLGTALGEYYLGQLVNQTLPGGLLGDAGRAVRARRQAGLLRAGQAVAFERLAGQAALFGGMAAAFAAGAAVPGGVDWPLWLVALGLAPAAALAALSALVALGGRLPGAPGRALADLRAAFRASVLARRVLPLQIGLSLATAGLNVAAFAFCLRATGTALPVAALAALVPAILCAMLVPLTVGGWGLREGAAAALLPLAGASAEAALAGSVAFGLVLAVAVLPGVLPLLRLRAAGPAPPLRP